MKKTILILAVVLACIFLMTTVSYATDRDGTETFTVSISSHSGIQSGSVSISYDSSIVEIESGTILVSGTFMSNFTASNGMGVFAYTNAVSLSGDVLTFTVKVKNTAEIGASCQITATVTLEPEAGNNIVENVTLGTITVTCSHTGSKTNVAATPATCQDFGYTAGVKCDICGEFVSGHEQISKADHTWGAWVDDQNGTTHTHTCTVCGTNSETNNHVWNDGVVTTDPTCVDKGVKTYTCTVCGATKTEDVDPTGQHTYGNWVDDKNGTTHTHTCTGCGTASETENHEWNNGEVTTQPTCSGKGEKTYTCTKCGATKKEDVDPTGQHTYGDWVDDKNGTTHTHTCTGCGTASETENHTWNNGAITTAPTCVAKGEKTYTCTKCGATKTEDVDPTGVHTWGAWVDDQNGTTHTHTCTVCGTNSETENHAWNKGVVTKKATCVEKGVKTYTCTVCGATKTEDIDPTGIHTWGAWVDDQNGTTHTHTCTVCGTNSETENHAWNKGVVTKKATCVEKGVKTYTCTVCGATKTEDIDPTGVHTWGSWVDDQNGTTHTHTCKVCGTNSETNNHEWNAGVITSAPDCIHSGVKTYTCTKCGATKTEDIDPTGVHTYGAWTNLSDTDHNHVCTVCGAEEKATHTFATVWSADGESHWHECTVCGAKKDVEAHVPGPRATERTPRKCTVCGYILEPAIAHVHKYSTTWTYTSMGHWHECEGCNEIDVFINHVYDNDCDTTCNICGYVRKKVNHHFAETWSSNGTQHWHECTVCGLKTDIAEHVPGVEATETTPQTCVVCGYVLKEALGHTHKFDTEWKFDGTSHWHECTAGDGAVSDKDGHTFGNWNVTKHATITSKGIKEHTCMVCGYKETEEFEGKRYNIIEGNDSTWTPASMSDGLKVRSDADFKEFIEVTMDGEVVDPKNYDAYEGSTVVVFKDEYLKTLSNGKHTIGIVSESGIATAELTISGNAENTSEGTQSSQQGGSTNKGCGSFIGFGAIAVIVCAAAAGVVVCRKKKEN